MTNREWLDEQFPGEIMVADGLDDALIGWGYSPARGHFAVYDVEKCIEIFAREMGYNDAVEFFEFNTEGAYVGEGTPVFMRRIDTEGL
jgi:hypothetical protein